MTKPTTARPQGQVRRSQVIRTFGPGSLLDLPDHSVIVGGLDNWTQDGEEVPEPRLVEKLKRLLDLKELKLLSPPGESDELTPGKKVGITAWQFPEWFITQDVLKTDPTRGIRSRVLVHRSGLVKGKYLDEDRKKHPVVPVRFVRACRKGHIGDIQWYYFVHAGNDACRRQLWLDETGTSGDISEIRVRCECGKWRLLGEAANPKRMALGSCDGYRPWLGPGFQKEGCGEPNRLLVRSASNAYFPRVMSVISLPDRDESLEKAVNQVWDFIEFIDDPDDLKLLRKKALISEVLKDFTDDEVYAEVLARKGFSGASPVKSVKQAEVEVLSACNQEVGTDRPDGTFYARLWPREKWETTQTQAWTGPLERVVLVHRLREVTALVGFTRFEAASPGVDGELEMGVQAADLAGEVSWLPAVENRGEGIFLGFRAEPLEDWLKRPAVQARYERLAEGFQRWLGEHSHSKRTLPGLPYLMLHSLSHLLITAVSLECGYPASSIRERIYPGPGGYGILLFTGTSDAEGTMGGLVEAGKHIDHHLRAALELGGLCSNDPVCAQHDPSSPHEHRYLQGAACHGCLLIAETSCEQFNDFLDRALVVPTLENLGAEFFKR
jgi:MrfA Zn-binding domain